MGHQNSSIVFSSVYNIANVLNIQNKLYGGFYDVYIFKKYRLLGFRKTGIFKNSKDDIFVS